jgi:hypothetical protein
VFKEFLQIRKSSPLFRLTTEEQVSADVSFFNTGPEQIPGLIVMRLEDVEDIDANYDEILVFFNANQQPIQFTESTMTGKTFTLHPALINSVDTVATHSAYDPGTGAFSIPPLSTSVFVLEE